VRWFFVYTMTPYIVHSRQRGTTLIELLIAVGITMLLVSAAAYVYLLTRESQGASERTSARDETGAFALQVLGHEIMNAGFYPATMPPPPPLAPASSPVTQRQVNTVSSYPPATSIPTANATDWIAPAAVYLNAIYGCEGSKFDHVTGSCGTTDHTLPDSIVVNYFTSESSDEAATMGQRRDCTGSDVGNDPSNAIRKLNSPTPIPAFGIVALTEDTTIAPQQPLFVSNRYGLNATNIVVNVGMNDQAVATQSLACSGNGSSFFGVTNTAAYQPILAGIDDMQFTYGVFQTDATRAPDRFYTADEVNGLGNVVIAGVSMGPWARVVAVRVCLMTSTLGANTKITDKAGELRTYLDCANQTQTQAATDLTLHKRHVQIFGVRNRLNQGF
jgi:type IV pilus assembly protein PilW